MLLIKHAIDKAGKSLGYNEVKKLQWKVIAEVVSGQNFFAVLPKGFRPNVIIHNPHISESRPLYQYEHSLTLEIRHCALFMHA